MSEAEDPTLTTSASAGATLASTMPPKKPAATHPYRVYGYKVTHDWVVQFGRDRGLELPDMSNDSLESATFMYLISHLRGLQRHFLDDPTDTDYGWSHCLSIANNWNPKKKPLVAGRLPTWKAVLGTEEEPRWYIPTRDTIPPIPRQYKGYVVHALQLSSGILNSVIFLHLRYQKAGSQDIFYAAL
ncbi:hypothetical protein OG21DRAFT_776385 [Imleria badia]|nr:hypothetical protein OG21DRAFT_776385 [Imleria badia]